MESIKIEPNDDDRCTDTDHNELVSIGNDFQSNHESEIVLENLLNRLSGIPNTMSTARNKTIICRNEEIPYQGNLVIKSEITIEEEVFGDEMLDTLSPKTTITHSFDADEPQNFCSLCKRQFATKSSLARHNRIHTGNLQQCEICYKKLTCNLQQHMATHTEEKVFECNQCDKRFSTLQYLQRHLKRTSVHSKNEIEKKIECEICHKKFADMDALMKHREIHFAEKPYECNYCHKTFITIMQLNRHEKIHFGEKVHKCQICDKRFLASSNLWQHELTHITVKDVQCDECDRRFAAKFQLQRHKHRVHTNFLKPKITPNRDFGCEFCDKRFSSRSLVRRHERIHTGEKPFGCKICGKRFAVVSNLQQHESIHVEEKMFSCDQCDKRFSAIFQMQKHKKRIHTIQSESDQLNRLERIQHGEKSFKEVYTIHSFATAQRKS